MIFFWFVIRVQFFRVLFCMFVPSRLLLYFESSLSTAHNEAAVEFLICMLKTHILLCYPLHHPVQPFPITISLPLTRPEIMGTELIVNSFASVHDANSTQRNDVK